MVSTSIGSTGKNAAIWSLTAELKDIVAADFGLMEQLVSLFLSDSANRLEVLARASKVEDFKSVRAQAHSLKGSALQMGANGFASLCATLELSPQLQPDQCASMVNAIANEFALLQPAMEGYIANDGRSL